MNSFGGMLFTTTVLELIMWWWICGMMAIVHSTVGTRSTISSEWSLPDDIHILHLCDSLGSWGIHSLWNSSGGLSDSHQRHSLHFCRTDLLSALHRGLPLVVEVHLLIGVSGRNWLSLSQYFLMVCLVSMLVSELELWKKERRVWSTGCGRSVYC